MLSEMKPADRPAEEASEILKTYEGQGDQINAAPDPDNATDADGLAAQKPTDSSGEDPQIIDNKSKETGSPSPSESDDGNISAGDKSEMAQAGKEIPHSEKDSNTKEEADDLASASSNDPLASAAFKMSNKDEDKDSGEETQDPDENDHTEKDGSNPQPDDAAVQTEDRPELASAPIKSLVKAALTVLLVAAVFSGFLIFENKLNRKANQKTTSEEVEEAVVPKSGYAINKPTVQPDDPNYIYHAKVKEITILRETLLHKEEEIRQLKKHYQEGIAELEKEIFDEMRSAETDTFLQALENKRIEFGLRTIQRRNAYMRQLDQPSAWIYKACEELLYLRRRAMVDLHVAEVASGIDMSMHMRHMNSAIEKYRPTADRLAVDMKDEPLESLEEIWEQIQSRNLQISNRRADSKNKVIFEEVCSGTFKRVTELSEISVEAAKCIAAMPGSDLFLNDLNAISPQAAKYLFQWKGSWLCLNGFKALSPRVANYLFQWDGGWISLNGLTEFPTEIGEVLLQWQGKQLELMGLRYTNSSFADIGIEYLVRWERSGGKLFVPKEVRDKIDEFKEDSA
jgi:hypothetical protein